MKPSISRFTSALVGRNEDHRDEESTARYIPIDAPVALKLDDSKLKEFNDILALCQFLPGPNIVNVSAVFGMRVRGVAGALACLTGLLGPPAVTAGQVLGWCLTAGTHKPPESGIPGHAVPDAHCA